MNASIKAFLSENIATCELIARHFDVYTPVVDTHGHDLLVLKNDKYVKLQVKASFATTGVYTFNCHYGKFVNKNYTYDMVDFFILYIDQHKIWYIIPAKEIIENSGNVSIRLCDCNKYNIYKNNWNLLEEYVENNN